MQVSVLYFAGLRATAGVERELLKSDAVSLAALYEQLRDRHGWRFETSALRVAVNDELVDWSRPLQEGDVIAFLPPFSGG
jgi:sulfur-carrier protein